MAETTLYIWKHITHILEPPKKLFSDLIITHWEVRKGFDSKWGFFCMVLCFMNIYANYYWKSIYKDSQRKYLTTRGNIAVLPPLVSVVGVAPGPSWLPVGVSAVVATISQHYFVRLFVFVGILWIPILAGASRDSHVFQSKVINSVNSYLTFKLT